LVRRSGGRRLELGFGEKKRNKWVLVKGHKSLFKVLFNTISAENELKYHFGKKRKLRCQNCDMQCARKIRHPLARSFVPIL
jgi:hypothetical protein